MHVSVRYTNAARGAGTVIGAIAVLTACSAGSVQPPLAGGGGAPASVSSPNAERAARQGVLFITDRSAGVVNVFSQNRGSKPIETISNGLNGPGGIAVDGSGNLFVVNLGNNTVTKYAPPYTGAPSMTYQTGSGASNQPTNVTVAKDGTLYVAEIAGGRFQAGQIVVFPPGSNTISLTLDAVGFPTYMTTDHAGNLYVSVNGPPDVETFVPGSTNGTRLGLQGLNDPAGLAFDGNGNLIVADSGAGSPAIDIFPPGSKTRSGTIGSGLIFPEGLALNKARTKLFVGDSRTPSNPSTAFAFTYPAGALVRKVQNKGYDVAVSPRAPF